MGRNWMCNKELGTDGKARGGDMIREWAEKDRGRCKGDKTAGFGLEGIGYRV